MQGSPLPCHNWQARDIHRSEQSEHDISKPLNKTVIIVDDDEAVRDSLSVMLTLAGLRVMTCKGRDDLLQMLEHVTPDCLVVDLHMPGMSGLELITQLNASGVKIPTILISGNMDGATEAQARRLGVSRLLKKPFSGAVLIGAVKEILAAN